MSLPAFAATAAFAATEEISKKKKNTSISERLKISSNLNYMEKKLKYYIQ